MSALITLKTIIVYSFPCLALMALITNLLLLIIFSRKTFQNTIFATYFRVYLVIDTFNLIFPINRMLELNLGIYFGLVSNILCKLRKFLPSWTNAITPWLLVIISFDRYLSIAHPSKFSFRKKFLFQILTSCFVIGFNFCMFTPLWFYYLKETIKTNETNNQTFIISYECLLPEKFFFRFIGILQQCIIPFCFMSLFTLLTIKTVFNSRESSSNNSTITKSKDMKFAVSSITFNIIFLLFNTPYFVFLVINNYTNLFIDRTEALYKILESIFNFFLNFNSIFILISNYISNSIFKKEFKSFVCGRNKTILTSKSKSTRNTSSK